MDSQRDRYSTLKMMVRLFYLKEPVLKIRTNTEEQSNKTVSNSVKQAILSVLGIRLRREKSEVNTQI